ncbi:hypothetical protein BJ912DRAFT_1065365 [Pholiota molesta]|nr:hypothetical protein BJ912DRAFT_1065365 [Pholiota molesta]
MLRLVSGSLSARASEPHLHLPAPGLRSPGRGVEAGTRCIADTAPCGGPFAPCPARAVFMNTNGVRASILSLAVNGALALPYAANATKHKLTATSAMPPSAQSCSAYNTGAPASEDAPMKRCCYYRARLYCGQECQTVDWTNCKRACGAPVAALVPESAEHLVRSLPMADRMRPRPRPATAPAIQPLYIYFSSSNP